MRNKVTTLSPSALIIDPQQLSSRLEKFICQMIDEFKRDGAIIGLSGGLDSSVVAALAVRSLSPTKVLGLIMPERDSHPDSVRDARLVGGQLGIEIQEEDLRPVLRKMGIYRLYPPTFFVPRQMQERYVESQQKQLMEETGQRPFYSSLEGTSHPRLSRAMAYFRSKHRLRMLTLYYHSELRNLLVVGTANKSEWLTGFFVKHGDGAADIMPLLPLYKTQVRELAKYLGIPQRIIDKPPSPDLIPGVTDEGAMGLSYQTLDLILYGLEKGFGEEEISAQLDVDLNLVGYVQRLIQRSAHLRSLPPSPQI